LKEVLMKWITHQSGALALALLFKADPALTAGMIAGAVAPDMAEHALSRGNRRIFLRIHRGILHWFGLYAGALVAIPLLPLSPAEQQAGAGLALGALSHLALDALNPTGVPLLPFRRTPRARVNLVSTGSPGEYLLLAALLALIGFCGYQLDPAWFKRLARLAG
jgi:membrane-bound metal-dependent hydrolase YbcI (DUF457 family)